MLPIEENRTRFIDELSAVDEKRDVSKLVAWLEKSDFFEAPASTRHHLDVKGGLCEHSLNVYTRMLSINESMGLDLDLDSIAICALCHDICKAYFYGTEQRNRKNDKGKWEKYDAYMIDDKFPIGHGEKSVKNEHWATRAESSRLYLLCRWRISAQRSGMRNNEQRQTSPIWTVNPSPAVCL
jgi:hypothetical protein